MKPEFVHLHNHSEYSLLDGVIRISDKSGGPSELLKQLAAEGSKGFAVTDHGNMYGSVEFYSNATKVGLKDPAAPYLQGLAEKRRGRVDDARNALRRVTPPDAPVCHQLGLLSLQEGQLAQAEQDFAEAW